MTVIRRFTMPLVFAFSLSLLFGCSDAGDKALFEIERLAFQADHLSKEKLSIKPELVTDSDYDLVIAAYSKVADAFDAGFSGLLTKDSLTNDEAMAVVLASKSQLEMARCYELKGDTTKAIEVLEEFSDKYPFGRDLGGQALMTLGELHESRANIERAETAWMKLLERYYPPSDRELRPHTDVLELPVRIARMHDLAGDSAKAAYYLDFAEKYYLRILKDFKFSPLGLTTSRFLADTYVLRRKSQEAIALLEEIKDSTGNLLGPARMLLADIYLKQTADTTAAIEQLKAVCDQPTDSIDHPKALLQLARIDLEHKKWDSARNYLATIENRFAGYRNVMSLGQSLKAKSYDLEGQFSQAMREYQWILTEYPNSREAIETYRYLPTFLKKNKQDELAEDWVRRSIDGLARIRDDNSGTMIGLSAQSNLANVYAESEQWDSAIAELVKLQNVYPEAYAGQGALLTAGNICMDKLNDREKAVEFYNRQIELYPENPASELAQKKLDEKN